MADLEGQVLSVEVESIVRSNQLQFGHSSGIPQNACAWRRALRTSGLSTALLECRSQCTKAHTAPYPVRRIICEYTEAYRQVC